MVRLHAQDIFPFDKGFKIGDAASAGVVVGDNPGVRRGIGRPMPPPGGAEQRAIPRFRVWGLPAVLLGRYPEHAVSGVFSWETPLVFFARLPGPGLQSTPASIACGCGRLILHMSMLGAAAGVTGGVGDRYPTRGAG